MAAVGRIEHFVGEVTAKEKRLAPAFGDRDVEAVVVAVKAGTTARAISTNILGSATNILGQVLQSNKRLNKASPWHGRLGWNLRMQAYREHGYRLEQCDGEPKAEKKKRGGYEIVGL